MQLEPGRERQSRSPLVSVVIPVYNVGEYLAECVESVRNQLYGNLDIILVDDGSTDSCPSICDQYALLDGRIRVIHKPHGGLSSARNAGVDSARGEYIGFVDSDDWIDPDMYSTLMELVVRYGADVAECGIRAFYPGRPPACKGGGGVLVLDNLSATAAFLDKSVDIAYSVCARLYRADIARKVRFPEGRLHEDAYFTYKALYFSTIYARASSCKYNYRRKRPGSIMTSPLTAKNIADVVDACEERNDFFFSLGQLDLYRKSKSAYYATLLSCLAEAGAKLPGEKPLAKSLAGKLRAAWRDILRHPPGVFWILKYLVFLLCPPLPAFIYWARGRLGQ